MSFLIIDEHHLKATRLPDHFLPLMWGQAVNGAISTVMNGQLKAFVEKADDDVIRLHALDLSIDQRITFLGFSVAAEPGIFTVVTIDDAHKAKIFEALQAMDVAFSDGKEWCPAEVFEFLRDMNLLSGSFIRVSWLKPGDYRLAVV